MSESFEDLCPDTQAAYTRMERALGVDTRPTKPLRTAGVEPSVRLRQMRQTLDTIMMAWGKAPQLRLGQLLENALGRYQSAPTFQVEDEALMLAICRFEQEFLCPTGSVSKPSGLPSV